MPEEGTQMHDTKSRPRRPRRSRAVGGVEGGSAVPPTAGSDPLPNLMTCGLRAGIALFFGVTTSVRPPEDVDPADLYGDFA
jgi:hypothetical protein